MIRRGRVQTSIRFAAGVAWLLTARPASADYRDTYAQAIRLYRAERWELAARAFERARDEHPNETGRVQISGNDTELYLPSYFLGDALMHLGVANCERVLAAWQRAEQVPEVRGNKAYVARIADGRSRCMATTPPPRIADKSTPVTPTPATSTPPSTTPPLPFDPQFANARTNAQTVLGEATAAERHAAEAGMSSAALQAAHDQLANAQKAFVDAESKKSVPGMAAAERGATASRDAFRALESNQLAATRALESNQLAATKARAVVAQATDADRRLGDLRDSRPRSAADVAKARADLARAGQLLASPAASASDIDTAATIASAARQIFTDTIASIAATHAAAVSQRVADATRELGRIETALRSSPNMPKALASRRNDMKGRLDAASQQLKRAQAQSDVALADETSTVVDKISADILALTRDIDSRATPRIPPDLVQAAREYFAGQYEKAHDVLDRMPAPSQLEIRLQIDLFRAASLFGLYVRSGERDESLKTAAAAAVNDCRRLSPSYAPDAMAFSPRFLKFYQAPW